MPLDYYELIAIEKKVQADFQGGFNSMPQSYDLFTKTITTSESITPFEFMGQLPKVREWIGPRRIEDMKKYDYTIKKKDWESTIKIPYFRLWEKSMTQLSKLAQGRAKDLGSTFSKDYPSDQVFEALENGDTNLAYDGYPYFSDLRTNVNLFAGAGTAKDNIIADLSKGRKTMRRYTDDQNRVMNIVGDLAVIPPELELVFDEIINSEKIDGSDNRFYGKYRYLVDGRLSDTGDWYFAATKEFITPIIFNEILGVKVDVKDNTFEDQSVLIGGSATGNVGYSFPELMIKFTN